MQTQAVMTLNPKRVGPVYYPDEARMVYVNLAPSLTLAAGTVLGRITNAAADVQTISDTGTVSGGTFTISGTNPITGNTFTTAAVAYNVSNANLQVALEAVLGTGNVTVAGSGLPTADTTITGAGALLNVPVPLMTVNNASITGGGSLAIAHTTVGRTADTYAAYLDSNSDGTEVAKCILASDVTTDAAGRVNKGTYSYGLTGADPAVDVWVKGYFRVTDLVGLDAAAVADLGRIVKGSATAGVLYVA